MEYIFYFLFLAILLILMIFLSAGNCFSKTFPNWEYKAMTRPILVLTEIEKPQKTSEMQ